jgi:hypothetical protein
MPLCKQYTRALIFQSFCKATKTTAWRRATTRRSALSRATSSRPRRCAASPNAKRVSLLVLPLPPLPAVLPSARFTTRCWETRYNSVCSLPQSICPRPRHHTRFSPPVRSLPTHAHTTHTHTHPRTHPHTHTHTHTDTDTDTHIDGKQ